MGHASLREFQAVATESLESRRLLSTSIIGNPGITIGYPGAAPDMLAIDVFNDLNGDGVRQSKEAALTDWSVKVRDRSGNVATQTWTTTSDGYAEKYFPNIARSNLELVLNVPHGWRITALPAKVTTAGSYYAHFGVTQRAAVSGTVFNDLDTNGLADPEDAAVARAQVYIDSNGNDGLDADEVSVRTNTRGEWSFPSLPPNHTYPVRLVRRAGIDMEYGVFDFVAARGAATTDALMMIRAGAARGDIFNDPNGDGARQSADPGLAGWRVYADLNDDSRFTRGEPYTLSGPDGSWLIPDLAAGDVRIRAESRVGWPATSGADGFPVESRAAQLAEGLNFGDQGVVISGTTYLDYVGNHRIDTGVDQAISGCRVYLDLNRNLSHDADEPSVLSDGGGHYEFSDQPAGTYSVRVARNDQSIGRFVTTPKTNGTASVTLVAGQSTAGIDFGLQLPASISGSVFRDADANGLLSDAGEDGLFGWTVYVDLNDNGVKDAHEPSTKSGELGAFRFDGLKPATYAVRVTPRDGWLMTSSGDGRELVDARRFDRTSHINVGVRTGGLSGRFFIDTNRNGVRDVGEVPVQASGYAVLRDGKDQWLGFDSNAQGLFDRPDLAPGTYDVYARTSSGNFPQIFPALAASRLNGDHYVLTITSAGEYRRHDFAMTLESSFLGGNIFNDENRNGVRDGNEGGVSLFDPQPYNFLVYIDSNNNGRHDDDEASVIPDPDQYYFNAVPDGSYILRLQIPSAWRATGGVDAIYRRAVANKSRFDNDFAVYLA